MWLGDVAGKTIFRNKLLVNEWYLIGLYYEDVNKVHLYFGENGPKCFFITALLIWLNRYPSGVHISSVLPNESNKSSEIK